MTDPDALRKSRDRLAYQVRTLRRRIAQCRCGVARQDNAEHSSVERETADGTDTRNRN